MFQKFTSMLPIAALFILSACAGSTPMPTSFTEAEQSGLVITRMRIDPDETTVPPPTITFAKWDEAAKALFRDERGRLSRFVVQRKRDMLGDGGMKAWEGFAVTVPPGTYVMATAKNPNNMGSTTDFNLGTVKFTVAPGEAVYIGDYSYWMADAEDLRIDKVAGDFLKHFFTLGVLFESKDYYTARVAFDQNAALAAVQDKMTLGVPVRQEELGYVSIPVEGKRNNQRFIVPFADGQEPALIEIAPDTE